MRLDRAFVAALMFASAVASAAPDPDPATFYGTAVASLGSFFGKLVLGQTTKPTLPQLHDTMEIELELTGKRVDGVVITISDTTRKPPACPRLHDELVRAWGEPIDNVWKADGRSMAFTTLDPPSCQLHLRRLAPEKQWLGSVVPVNAIGKPVAQLVTTLDALEPEAEHENLVTNDHEIRWRDVGIDGQQIDLVAFVSHGRVVGIEVALMHDPELGAWKRVIAKYGAPDTAVGDDGQRQWTWRHAPVIDVVNDASDEMRTIDPHPKSPNPYSHTSIRFGRTH
jgi:hypothetical protein